MIQRPKNKAEGLFFDEMVKEGWNLNKRGWPDFICFKNDNMIVVEVKPKRGYRLKKEQMKTMKALAKCGVECYRWSPDGGFEQIIAPMQRIGGL